MLERRGLLPEFTVTSVDGTPFSYGEVWQRKTIVLVSLGAASGPHDALRLTRLQSALAASGADTAAVITADAVAGEAGPFALVADQWGEIHYLARAPRSDDLPTDAELLEWLAYVRHQCPECQGEAL